MEKPRERILESSILLFYKQGYDYTSINQIIEDSGTHKASFYRYYPDKTSIGLDYLDTQGASIRNLIQKLANKSDSIEDFLNSWVKILKKQSKSGAFLGCPITRFLNGNFIEEPNLQKKGYSILVSWITEIEKFCERLKETGNLDSDFPSLYFARKVIKLFQGNSSMFVISHDIRVWDEFVRDVLGNK